ncbi:MAG: FliH/SctL family protein [Lachnospiraceae bacterium]|nr:FliH/SctL family protein [Lachnospiraceae bacterium]
MRSLYSTLLKYGTVQWDGSDKRVINSNDLVEKKLKSIEAELLKKSDAEGYETDFADGFSEGIQAEQVSALLDQDQHEIPESPEAEALRMQEEARQSLEDAEHVLEQARKEAEEIIQQAMAQAEEQKQQIFDEAESAGYREGAGKAAEERSRLEASFADKEKKLEQQYQNKIDELEPAFIQNLTGIYEHIFHVDLSSYREVLIYLIGKTLRKIDGGHDFLIHVSKEDYPFISMRKKELFAGIATAGNTAEIIEDSTLRKNDCLIETTNGIFDCGVDTQLAELGKKLELLSYKKEQED